ncbi:hypothetical protein OUZ56_011282 [Daphnia magna]|uniref:Uncharacterized protein n=1 Tax=Daphnia magna TaxID=35525 RepID=A0ABQ9YZP9_9CRUS|nr:hypothetical protein OUZ56_011282 [Daphnia magna]
MWYHLRHRTPGTSERKIFKTLDEFSLDNDRLSLTFWTVNIINRSLFNRARREFEFYQYLKEKIILRLHGNSEICGHHPHGMHADAIRKLYRFAAAKVKFSNQVKEMIYVVPRLGRWPMVLYNGHWEKDGADMLGEEQEQVFSYMARLGPTTKHQSRRDDITSAILYFNVDKKKRVVAALCLWMNRCLSEKTMSLSTLGSLRYKEAIVQTKMEMGEFIQSLTSLCKDLESDIADNEKIRPVTILDYSRSVLANTEIARICGIIDRAVHQFTDAHNLKFLEDFEIEQDDFLEQVEKEEDLLEALQELTDEKNDEFSEDDYRASD